MAPQTHIRNIETKKCSLLFIYLYIWRFIYFTGHFFPLILLFICCLFCHPHEGYDAFAIPQHFKITIFSLFLFLFVRIVTFYKSWQDNILPLQKYRKIPFDCYRCPCTMQSHIPQPARYVSREQKKIRQTFGVSWDGHCQFFSFCCLLSRHIHSW